MSVLNEVINQFAFKGELENCEIFGSGHINTTYLRHRDRKSVV